MAEPKEIVIDPDALDAAGKELFETHHYGESIEPSIAKLLDKYRVEKTNPNHGPDGKFSTSSGKGGGGFDPRGAAKGLSREQRAANKAADIDMTKEEIESIHALTKPQRKLYVSARRYGVSHIDAMNGVQGV